MFQSMLSWLYFIFRLEANQKHNGSDTWCLTAAHIMALKKQREEKSKRESAGDKAYSIKSCTMTHSQPGCLLSFHHISVMPSNYEFISQLTKWSCRPHNSITFPNSPLLNIDGLGIMLSS